MAGHHGLHLTYSNVTVEPTELMQTTSAFGTGAVGNVIFTDEH